MSWGGLVALGLMTALGVAACFAYDRRRSGRRVDQLVSWFDAMRQGDFSASRVPFDLPGGRRVRAAAEALAAATRSLIGQLSDAAQLDPLTRLHNREFFRRLVSPYISELAPGSQHGMLFIDIDGFKRINDTLGHNLGDRLLQVAAERLRLSVRIGGSRPPDPSDPLLCPQIARFGGDEFVIFVPNLAGGAVAQKIAARILRVLAEPFELGTHSAHVSASIGIALAPVHGDNYRDLLRAADTAMYHAKRSGRNCCVIYDSALDEETRREVETEQELRDAIARGEFILFFQPLYDIDTFEICSAEALIRWNHPRRGIVPPTEFIPLAERAHLINQIGEWLINEATKRIAEFVKAGYPIMISINISPEQLERVEFAAMIRAALQLWKVPPHLLQLEMTENVAMRDSDRAAERLHQVSSIGVSIAIDDFGTGYSNLSSLMNLPFSRLKIDQSLIKDLTTRDDAHILVQTIISMAKNLGLQSVAEGVETRAQLDQLSAMGCDVMQGYYMSRPVSIDQFKSLLARGVKPSRRPANQIDAA